MLILPLPLFIPLNVMQRLKTDPALMARAISKNRIILR